MAASDQHANDDPYVLAGGGVAESQRRGEQALQTELDAVADGLADLMEHFLPSDEDKDAISRKMSAT